MWYCLSAPQTIPYKVTVHLSAAPSDGMGFIIRDYHAASGSWSFDQSSTNHAANSAGPADTGVTGTTAGANEVAVSGFANDNSTGTVFFGATQTADGSTIGTWGAGVEFAYFSDNESGDAILSATGTVGVQRTTGGTTDWTAVVGTFQP